MNIPSSLDHAQQIVELRSIDLTSADPLPSEDSDSVEVRNAPRDGPHPSRLYRRALQLVGNLRLTNGSFGYLDGIRYVLPGLSQILLLLALWQSVKLMTDSVLFPSPADVLAAFWQLVTAGDVQGNTLEWNLWVSLVRVMRGFLWALITGIPLGIFLGLSARTYGWLKVIVEPARFVPPLAWVPVATIFLSGSARYTFIIWLGTFFPVLLASMAGVHNVERSLWEVGETLGGKRWQLVWKIVLPSSAPTIAAGARLGLGIGWACIVAAEMIGGASVGIGSMIYNYGELIRVDAVVVGIIAIGFLGYFLNEIFLALETYLFPWQKNIKL
ncbi:ABC transporter permease [Bradyrhizobium genosp. P]|uniref:ABC transporter permease n=1 Tax=Bradyrhizobium genosp. P TaxID=83641 RepID=UPI003CF706AC